MNRRRIAALLMALMMGCGIFTSGAFGENTSKGGLPKFYNGKNGEVKNNERKTASLGDAVDFLMDNKEVFKYDGGLEFAEKETIKDEMGYTHIKMTQKYGGIGVYGREYVVHYDKENNIYAINGDVDLKIKDKLYQKTPVEKAVDKWRGRRELTFDDAVKMAKENIGDMEYSDDVSVETFYYEFEGKYYKVHKVELRFLYPQPGNWDVFVRADNGEVLDKINNILHANSISVGIGVLGDQKNIRTTRYNGLYYLFESKNTGTNIATFDAGNSDSRNLLPGNYYVGSDNVFSDTRDRAAVDAQIYASTVFDFFRDRFGRNSIDNRGMDVISTVHYGKNYANAFWNGKQMVYGDGDGNMKALSGALDVVGHELTHGITNHTADLIYKDQSGALNESFSDVFGTLIEFAYQPQKGDWLIGEDLYNSGALRSMSDPEKYRQPAHMKDYIITQKDNGGVHYNSGIPNRAAYLIGENIGLIKTGQIYYRALTTYLTKTSDFKDAKSALMQSAIDYFGYGSREMQVVQWAFDQVGI